MSDVSSLTVILTAFLIVSFGLLCFQVRKEGRGSIALGPACAAGTGLLLLGMMAVAAFCIQRFPSPNWRFVVVFIPPVVLVGGYAAIHRLLRLCLKGGKT